MEYKSIPGEYYLMVLCYEIESVQISNWKERMVFYVFINCFFSLK